MVCGVEHSADFVCQVFQLQKKYAKTTGKTRNAIHHILKKYDGEASIFLNSKINAGPTCTTAGTRLQIGGIFLTKSINSHDPTNLGVSKHVCDHNLAAIKPSQRPTCVFRAWRPECIGEGKNLNFGAWPRRNVCANTKLSLMRPCVLTSLCLSLLEGVEKWVD